MVPSALNRVRMLLAARVGIDGRSLAAFRIALALAMLADLAIRAGDLRAHYTDAGLLNRADALEIYDFLHAWPLCVHLVGGSVWSQVLLFAIAVGAAIALLVGWRTRVATVIAWLLTASVQLRDPYVGAGYDALLRMLLLWGCFLPLGSCWSVDAVDLASARPRTVSVGSTALLAQVVIVYVSAGWTKWQVPGWHDGSALVRIFADDFRATAIGLRLSEQPDFVRAVGRTVPWIEMILPVVMVVTGGWVRAMAAASLCVLNVAFAICLKVGFFPLVASVGLLAFVPGELWQRTPKEPIGANTAAARLDGRLRHVSAFAAAVVLAWVVWWSIEVARTPVFRAPPQLEWLGATLFLQQDWRMFSEPPSRTGWVIAPGRLRDGSEIDLLAAGGPPPRTKVAVQRERPAVPSRQFKNDRWRNFMARAAYGTRNDFRLLHWGRYVCREWNARHVGDDELVGFEVVFMQRNMDVDSAIYRAEVVWTHRCFG
jgi:hypothetical protein